MASDWIAWHAEYADPDSSLSRRLRVVRDYLQRALGTVSSGAPLRLISLCAGDGRDALPVLAAAAPEAEARLVELDPQLAADARRNAATLDLTGVTVECADAGVVDSYLGSAPAHIVLACGVFGNVAAAAARRTVDALPSLLTPGGIAIWTRGRGDDADDPAQQVRGWFADAGFDELGFAAPDDARFRVGMHRLYRAPDRLPEPGTVLFRFE